MKNFRDLLVWYRAHRFTLSVYSATRSFPKEEQYGLTNQLRRAASSIPANIAEGCGKGSDADFNRYLQIAFGSASEAEYHLLLAKDLDMLHADSYADLHATVVEIKKMLGSLISRMRKG